MSGPVPTSPPPTQSGLRILVLDPIGHLFGNLDHAVCEGLVDQGCEVILATNERAPQRGTVARYRRIVPYRGMVGDAGKISKAIGFLRSRSRVLKAVDEVRPDVVLLYYLIEPRLDGRMLATLRQRGVTTVVCAHDALSLGSDSPSMEAHAKAYLAAARVLVFGERGEQQLVKEMGIPPDRVVRSFLGVDREPLTSDGDRAAARSRLGMEHDEEVVLCFGQIKRNKGLGDLLRAFASVAAARPKARLWVVGRPWKVDTSAFLDLAEELGLADRVVFRFDWVNKEDVADWFRAADVAVLSYTHLYQSAVAGKACAHGLPLVATTVGNLPELVEDGVSGWLVPPSDHPALARALGEALADPEQARARGLAARESVRERFDWRVFSADLAALCARTTNRRSAHVRPSPGRKSHSLRIAVLGTRGVPANYGGYETFAEEVAVRLAARGHDVTVYGRSHHVPAELKEWRGVRLVTQPTIRTKHLDTVAHGFLSCAKAATADHEIILICNAVNSLACLFPRLTGKKVAMNVDGLDWTRRKWGPLGRVVALLGARMALWFPHHLITDARVVQRFYRERFHTESIFIPYGGRTLDAPPAGTDALARLGLVPGRYVLYVSRLEPENNAHEVIEAFEGVKGDVQLAIVGSAPYSDEYVASLHATTDERVVFTGGVYGDDYLQLQQNALAYVQATEVGGTHPALLEGMGAGRCVVYNDVPEHVEVIGEAGLSYRGADQLRQRLQELIDDPQRVADLGAKAREIVARRYDWEDVTDRYEALFYDMLDGGYLMGRLHEGEASWREEQRDGPRVAASTRIDAR
jgi:glycosyltransferase involved in cell wall biosynthesis